MILPTTQKFMINHLGFFYVLKYPQKVWQLDLSALEGMLCSPAGPPSSESLRKPPSLHTQPPPALL